MFEYKVQASWVVWKAKKKIKKKKGSFLKMDFVSDMLQCTFYKTVTNTEEEIESIHDFSPRNDFYFRIFF